MRDAIIIDYFGTNKGAYKNECFFSATRGYRRVERRAAHHHETRRYEIETIKF